MKRRPVTVARDIEIDYVEGQFRIEGVPFPFAIGSEPEVEMIAGHFPIVRVDIRAHNVKVITSPVELDDYYDVRVGRQSEWVDATVNRIIEERMADTLTWLRNSGRDA